MKLINRKENIFNDNIAYLEQYDFSKANLNETNRLQAVTTVASICYGNQKSIGSESLYNKLMAESLGLPSSSFEFVPILLKMENILKLAEQTNLKINSLLTHSYVDNDRQITIINLRTLVELIGDKARGNFYNTEEECAIIAEYFKVFKCKVDLSTRSQLVRHRKANYQELSRRFVSGNKQPFEFYVSEKLKNIEVSMVKKSPSSCGSYFHSQRIEYNMGDLIEYGLAFYNEAIKNGVKPEEARRIIPQAAYTELWHAWLPDSLDNFYRLRLDKHAQWEIRQLAEAMKELENSGDGNGDE